MQHRCANLMIASLAIVLWFILILICNMHVMCALFVLLHYVPCSVCDIYCNAMLFIIITIQYREWGTRLELHYSISCYQLIQINVSRGFLAQSLSIRMADALELFWFLFFPILFFLGFHFNASRNVKGKWKTKPITMMIL